MVIGHLPYRTDILHDAILAGPGRHAAGRAEPDPKAARYAQIRLGEGPAREERLLAQKDALIQQLELLRPITGS